MSETCACNGNCTNKNNNTNNINNEDIKNLMTSAMGLAAGSIASGISGLLGTNNYGGNMNAYRPSEVKSLMEVATLNGIDINDKLFFYIVDKIYDEQSRSITNVATVASELIEKFSDLKASKKEIEIKEKKEIKETIKATEDIDGDVAIEDTYEESEEYEVEIEEETEDLD